MKNSKFKSQILNKPKQMGFTLMELTVVLAIMGVILGLVIIDFARQRSERDSRIAQNELVTSIRKVQSYSLFSKNVGNVKPAQYYILKFNSNTPDRYFIQAITDAASAPALNEMETIMFPRNVTFNSLNPFTITRPAPLPGPPSPPACVLLAFKSPFGKAYVNDGCSSTNPGFQTGDDYKKILDHVNNVNNLSVSTDTDLLISLIYQNSNKIKKVLIKGITGLVCPTVNDTVCSF